MPQLPGGQGSALPRAWGRFNWGLACTFGVGADLPRAPGANVSFLLNLAPGRCPVKRCDWWGVAMILASVASRAKYCQNALVNQNCFTNGQRHKRTRN